MTHDQLTADEVLQALFAHIGETGHAEIRKGGALYIQAEDNAGWQYVGTVAEPADALGVIHDFFS
jgi:hypothetical protein